MQLTLWGYDFPFSNPISSMMFKRARMIYTGLPGGPADAKLDTVYFTQWSDPDLGTYTDDYVGVIQPSVLVTCTMVIPLMISS